MDSRFHVRDCSIDCRRLHLSEEEEELLASSGINKVGLLSHCEVGICQVTKIDFASVQTVRTILTYSEI